ncbi:MAG: hypothetical protein PUC06_08870, partial [Oscillospiraceae bacterium]|nr:hypothetical protein [Oscillospiraceae bacterium]
MNISNKRQLRRLFLLKRLPLFVAVWENPAERSVFHVDFFRSVYYNNVYEINRKAVYSRGKGRAISQKQLIGAVFAIVRHCYNAYFRWNAGALQRNV